MSILKLMVDDHANRPEISSNTGHSVAEIQEWIVRHLTEELHVPQDKIQLDQPLLSFGIDSVQLVSLTSELEDWGGFRFSENPLDEHPTISQLSKFVAELMRMKTPQTKGVAPSDKA